ncbi:MAG TPA: CdaR family protein [Anaerolineae bacterium]|nr:CdaR family protein [Anaerolineae bacterium]
MALALAIMVWMAATIQENPFAEGSFPELVPVEVANRGEGLVIMGGLVQEVRIRVRAPESVWEDLGSSGFRAYVDLEGLGVGLHEVPVRVEPASSLVRILETSPAALTVRLDIRAEKTVGVRVSVYGNPPLGYGAGIALVEPSQVRVSGPQTLVDQVAQLAAEVYLSGEKDTFERSASLTPRDEVGNAVDGLELEQKSARVTVPIEQQVGYRELSIKTIIEGNTAPGYWISSITANPSTVTVFGDPGAVNDIPGYLETYPVNVVGERESVSQRVAIVFPEGVSSLEDMGTVQALIEISPVLSGQTVQLTPVIRGLGRGLEATFSPGTVEVILSGPLSELEALEAGDVRVILDLSNYEPGTHFVSLVVERPGSLQVQAVLPDQVEVVIGES